MLGEVLLDIVYNIVVIILTVFIPADLVWNVSTDAMAPFISIVQSVCYFLPVGTISSIVGIIIAFGIFRAGVRLVATIWDLLPIV